MSADGVSKKLSIAQLLQTSYREGVCHMKTSKLLLQNNLKIFEKYCVIADKGRQGEEGMTK